MPLIHDAFGPQGTQAKQEALSRCCQCALNSMGCPDWATALLEYQKLAKLFSRLAQPGQPLANQSNREIWSQCLDPGFLKENYPGRQPLQIQDLVRLYQCIEDGSCNVERGFAQTRECIQEHKTTDIEVLDDVAVVRSFPLNAEDVAVERNGVWECGEFGLECGCLWRQVLGARMGVYSHGVKVTNNVGTYKHVKGGVLKAIGAIATSTNYRSQPFTGQQPSLASALGQRTRKSLAGTPSCPHWNKEFFIPENVVVMQIKKMF